ncbi:MAG TPA: hypothetical protein VLE24_02410 [Methyloceanibacter sp.]|nr:hypothetical protein [Methyloceanibacter sp.]
MLLRPQAMAGLIFAAGFLAGQVAIAEPLDKESCANLQIERNKLLTRDMQAALDQGPDWVKDHLNDESIERVRHFLSVEEQIQFRCRGGGVAKVPAKSTDAAPENAATVPLPDRKPTMPAADSGDGKPSQAVADSDKTPPGKSKATR